MSEQKLSAKDAIEGLKRLFGEYELDLPCTDSLKIMHMAINALENQIKYDGYEKRLENVYGECEGLLDVVIDFLERHDLISIPTDTYKARLLTDGNVDMWDAYKKIGTVDDILKLKEKATPKRPYIQYDGHEELEINYYGCPVCGSFVVGENDCDDEYYKPNYCIDCGQALDWSD